VPFLGSQIARLITWENDSRRLDLARRSRSYASRSTEIVFVAIHRPIHRHRVNVNEDSPTPLMSFRNTIKQIERIPPSTYLSGSNQPEQEVAEDSGSN